MRYDPKDWIFLSQRQNMSPFPNYMSMEAMCSRLKEYTGVKLSRLLLFFEDRIMTGFVPKSSFREAGGENFERIKKEPRLYRKLVDQENAWGRKLVQYAKRSGIEAKKTASPKKLLSLYRGYERLYKHVYAAYGSVWIVEDVLNAHLFTLVQKRVSEFTEASTMLNALTRQPSAMVARIERQALYQLAAKISRNAVWKKALREGKARQQQTLTRLIQAHEKHYFWLTRDYEDAALTFQDIVERLQRALRNDPTKVYKAMREELAEYAREQARYEKVLRLAKLEQSLFQTMRDIAHLKELRKRYVSESLFYFDPVLSNITQHAGLSMKQVRFLRTQDVKDALMSKKDIANEANERIKLSVWFTDGRKTQVLTGKKASELKTRFVQPPKSLKELRGQPVSPGIGKGPVRIILNPSEINKVRKGDVIVTIQVVPSFSPALHRAAGLVCDGGHGITSHPAILAREAKIPAIIKTRFAREVLKNGDVVEVNGFTGVARKL